MEIGLDGGKVEGDSLRWNWIEHGLSRVADARDHDVFRTGRGERGVTYPVG